MGKGSLALSANSSAPTETWMLKQVQHDEVC